MSRVVTRPYVHLEYSLSVRSRRGRPPTARPELCVRSQTQVDTPQHTHRATKHDPLIDGYPQEANEAYRRPKFVSVLHHRPRIVHAVADDHIHSVDARLVQRIDIAYVTQEHERIDEGTDRLVEHKLDQDIGFAERCLCGVGLGTGLLGRRRGWRRGHICGELVFEEALPDDVWRVAEDAEEHEFEYRRVVEAEGRLGQMSAGKPRACRIAQWCAPCFGRPL